VLLTVLSASLIFEYLTVSCDGMWRRTVW